MIKTTNQNKYKYSVSEIVNLFNYLLSDERFKQAINDKKFTQADIDLFKKLIFFKSKRAVFQYIIRNFSEKNDDLLFLSIADYKKLIFLINLLSPPYSAKNAAILAGFSPKTAKQQGSRLLKEIKKLYTTVDHC